MKFNWYQTEYLLYLETKKSFYVHISDYRDKNVVGYILHEGVRLFYIIGELNTVKKELQKKAKNLGIVNY